MYSTKKAKISKLAIRIDHGVVFFKRNTLIIRKISELTVLIISNVLRLSSDKQQ